MNLPFKLLFDRSLRPSARSSTMVSMANSLAVIARALNVVVLREYGLDLSAPAPSRADLERDVYEPMYPDDAKEAIREEIERLQALERDFEAGNVSGGASGVSGASGGLKSHPNSLETQIGRFGESGIRFAGRNARGDDSDAHDELTEQERDFLAEIGSETESEDRS